MKASKRRDDLEKLQERLEASQAEVWVAMLEEEASLQRLQAAEDTILQQREIVGSPSFLGGGRGSIKKVYPRNKFWVCRSLPYIQTNIITQTSMVITTTVCSRISERVEPNVAASQQESEIDTMEIPKHPRKSLKPLGRNGLQRGGMWKKKPY
jgi:hypothetical protein